MAARESMEHDPRASCLAADRVGALAHRVLATDPGGIILASHSRAAYLLSAGGELLWLAPVGIPMHRRGVQVAGPVPRTETGSPYQVADAELLFGTEEAIDLRGAIAWEPERWSWPRPLRTTPARDIGDTPGPMRELPPARGFGAFLPALSACARGGAFPSEAPQQDPVLARASPSVYGIAQACRDRDGAALLEHGVGLVGLGEGLTPSGDDFLGGVLFSLAVLRDAGVRLRGCSPGTVASFLESVRGRTNRISFALLSDHAAGHSCEPAHRLVVALLGQQSAEAISRAVSELVRLGHSTGWDLFTGVWTTWTLIPADGWVFRQRAASTTAAAAP